jgi:uncharacterized phage protein gp47/JayE
MAIEVNSFTELDAATVRQEEELLAQLLQEAEPNIQFRQGVLKELLLHLNAVMATKNSEELSRLRRSSSLQEIQVDPSLADDDAVDKIASNFRVTRKTGEKATGSVRVVVDRLSPITIAAGSTWEAGGKFYINESAFAGKTTAANVVSSTDRVLTPVGDGTYYFVIELVAQEVGAAGAIKRDTVLTPQQAPLYFVTAYAAEDFSNGIDEESNDELSARLVQGAACKALSGSVHMSAALKDKENFANVLQDSVVGYGDSEMLRDKHSLFPGSFGGRVDWYIRTQRLPTETALTKTATLVEKTEDGYGIWQFGIERDEAPGFYDVKSIAGVEAGETAGTLEITEDIRSADLSAVEGDDFVPDIANGTEAAYSRFQAGVIRFKDNQVPTTSLTVASSTRDYVATVRHMPLIAEIQEWASGRGVRNRAGDVLIKAPVPCFLKVSFTINFKQGTSTPSTATIKNDIAEFVNSYGFVGKLPASAISDIVHNSLSGIQYLSAIDMLGDIRKPDGQIRRIRSTELLVIPEEFSVMSSPRTAVFICDPNDISITVSQANVPEI